MVSGCAGHRAAGMGRHCSIREAALVFVAALNPKLPATDLLLIEIRRPRAMFLCVLFGAMTVALTIGLLTCSSSTPTPSTPRKR